MRRRVLAALSGTLAVLGTVAGVSTASPAAAVDNGEALTPPMGWNDWNSFGCDINEQDVLDTIDLFVSTGLKDAGYEYINIDDCWAAPTRTADGKLQADPVDFPHGIAYLADAAHEAGLKLGIYSSAGDQTCARVQPGSLGYEYVDAKTFSDWGVDYLKYDNCGMQTGYTDDQASYEARYQVMADALAQVKAEGGRSILYSVCEWGKYEPWEWADDQANTWRTTFDISDTYASMLDIFQQNVVLDEYASPGAWNDPDMLQVGNGGMTDAEYRSHFSLWAMMAAPLLIGTDLREASDATMETFLNTDVIAIDQDSLGEQASLVSDANGLYVLTKPLANGDTAVALFNSTSVNQSISTTASEVDAASGKTYTLTDLWSKQVTETTGTISAFVPAHETVVYRVSGASRGQTAANSTTLSLSSDTASLTPGQSATVTVTLQNNGKDALNHADLALQVPEGWRVTQLQGSKSAVPPGKTGTATFRVTAPRTATEPISTATLTATASYKGGRGGTVTAQSSIGQTVAVPVSSYRTADTTAGGTTFGELNGTLAIDAAGEGVSPPGFSFVGTTPATDGYAAIYADDALDADDVVTVTVASQEGTSSSDKAGIMVRNDMNAAGTPVGVALYVTGGSTVAMTSATDGGTSYTVEYPAAAGFGPSGVAVTGTVSLKLARSGSTYTGYWSTDGGTTWTQLGTAGVTVASSAAAPLQDAGVFATSGTEGLQQQATFTGFAVS